MGQGFPAGFSPGRNELTEDPRMSRPWLRERADKLLGVHVPRVLVPQWEAVLVVPGYARDKVVPTHFRAYTRTEDGTIWADAGPSYEEARWNLEQRVRNA